LVQHSYWNLDQQPNLALHRLTVPRGHHHWPTDARELPTQCTPVEGTCFDFRAGAGFAAGDIDALDASIALTPSEGLCHAATLAVADMAMDLYTDRPNLHVYASRYLQATARPLGAAHAKGAGLCLETEDLPNGPALGEPVWYGPDRDYTHTMLFRFRNPSAPDPMD
jgi:aldose 1-epimerase